MNVRGEENVGLLKKVHVFGNGLDTEDIEWFKVCMLWR